MKHNKKNIIELLNRIIKNKWAMYHMFNADGKENAANKYIWEAMAYENCLALITNKKFFDSYVDIFINHNYEKNDQ